MIFPFLQGFKNFDEAPLTWMIIFFNFMLYFTFFPSQFHSHNQVEKHLANVDMQRAQGEIYLHYLGEKDKLSLNTTEKKLLDRHRSGHDVGEQAIRLSMQDVTFLTASDDLKVPGDQVALLEWKKWVRAFHQDNSLRPMVQYGISYLNHSSVNWITYQYIHAGSMHLLTNMLVLLLVGGALEPVVGSLTFVLLYTLFGVAGAHGFTWIHGVGVAPLVGASAAVSGVIAYYAILETKKRIAFGYFLGPFRGYYGLIFLPTWLIFPFCFLGDIAQLLQGSMGGVAYSAHLGGGLMGCVMAFAFKPLHTHYLAKAKRKSAI